MDIEETIKEIPYRKDYLIILTKAKEDFLWGYEIIAVYGGEQKGKGRQPLPFAQALKEAKGIGKGLLDTE